MKTRQTELHTSLSCQTLDSCVRALITLVGRYIGIIMQNRIKDFHTSK